MRHQTLVILGLLFGAVLGVIATDDVKARRPVIATELGNPFYEGADSPQELADILECDMDPARGNNPGNRIINVGMCGAPGDRAFASPNDYLALLPVTDPASGVTDVRQLPGYFRSLVVEDPPAGRVGSAWLKPSNGSETGWKPEANGLQRAFRQDEKAWVNPKTGKIVFLSNCTNPVSVPERPRIVCAYIMLRVDTDDRSLRVAEYSKNGRRLVDRDCNPAIRQVGSDSWESPWFEHCPRFDCTFAGADRTLGGYGYQRTRKGSFALGEAGWVVLRVPVHVTENGSAYAYNFCIDSYIYGDSCGITAVPGDYYTSHVAVIGYRSGEYPDTHPTGRRFAWHGNVGVWDFRHRNCP